MCRLFNHKLGALLLSLLLVVSIVGFPSRAEAAKVAKAIAFDPGATMINVASVYETTPTTQKSMLKSLKSMKTMKKAPGYAGSALLQSDDGTRIITLSQWQDLASYQAFLTPPTEGAKETEKKSKTPPAPPAKTIVFEIGKTQSAREGIIPAVKGKEAVVEFSDFTLKDAADKDKVVAGVEKLIPSALLKQPTPRSVILLSSSDSPEVALMANWNCTADFEEGEKPGAIEAPDAELAALVDVDSHLYNVVSILPAEAKKPEKTEES